MKYRILVLLGSVVKGTKGCPGIEYEGVFIWEQERHWLGGCP